MQGEHVAEYMSEMRDEEPEKYNEHFSSVRPPFSCSVMHFISIIIISRNKANEARPDV